MKKTSVYLDTGLDRQLARRASEEGVTKAEFIRRTLAAAAERPPGRPTVGAFDGPPDLAAEADRHLGESGFGRS